MESFSNCFLFFYFCFVFVLASLLCPVPPLLSVVATSSVVNETAPCTTNSTTGHGHHKWIGPIGHRLITVDINGLGRFRSVQDAVDAVPENNRKNVLIRISAGHYTEKVVVPETKPYITMQGAGREVTFIEWHDRVKEKEKLQRTLTLQHNVDGPLVVGPELLASKTKQLCKRVDGQLSAGFSSSSKPHIYPNHM